MTQVALIEGQFVTSVDAGGYDLLSLAEPSHCHPIPHWHQWRWGRGAVKSNSLERAPVFASITRLALTSVIVPYWCIPCCVQFLWICSRMGQIINQGDGLLSVAMGAARA